MKMGTRASEVFPGRVNWPRKIPECAEDVFERCDRSGGPDACWPWLAACTARGYGISRHNKKNIQTTRLLWLFIHGRMPSKKESVCHHCDNPPCINPAHLFIGTRSDNMQDCVRKGRHDSMRNPQKHRGEKNANSKLTEKDARAILVAGKSTEELAIIYGVSKHTISGIKSGRLWRHLYLWREARGLLPEKPIYPRAKNYGGWPRLKETDVPVIRERLRAGQSGASLAREYRVSKGTIYCIAKRKTWMHIP